MFSSLKNSTKTNKQKIAQLISVVFVDYSPNVCNHSLWNIGATKKYKSDGQEQR